MMEVPNKYEQNYNTPTSLQSLCSANMENYPSNIFSTYHRAIMNFTRKNEELEAENTALKNLMLKKKFNWSQEREKIYKEMDSLVSTLSKTQNNLNSLLKDFETKNVQQKALDTRCVEMDKKLKEKEEEICSLKESLRLQQNETKRVKKQWKAESDRVKEMQLSFNRSIMQFNEEWESQLTVGEEKATTNLEALQESCIKRMKDLMEEKDEMMASAFSETMALIVKILGHVAKVKSMETKIDQTEIKWQAKAEALERDLLREQTEKKACLKRIEAMKKYIREVLERFLAEEEYWFYQSNRMEEDLEFLMLQDIELQVHHNSSF
ncbi:trichohyalin-like protein [Lates japonicus]|uniref:Trichohyalin-like protein n=1 Tax=Lates japonicus TaxID=270547 RepID=A0AAD3M582_LATJO|nr:trichohyalin-like protein [Lates japonicus]